MEVQVYIHVFELLVAHPYSSEKELMVILQLQPQLIQYMDFIVLLSS